LGQQWELQSNGDTWDISELPKGTYFLRAADETGLPLGSTTVIIQ
jgi:hypothetical protein